ncbi:MAG TPA: LacI family DNA-binding transcriptional regulator [Nocardioidaceae bacterium]|nr:LacI family DNA-binding transcriptional regulator [Nocardioidaceae bacterium]
MRPTIRDVARHAGVSIATVSRVMRDHENVSPGTRDRVAAAVRELEFTPSRLGRSLAERRHAANAIVFPDLSGPYYAEVVLGYESVAAELGRSVLILSTHGRAAAPAMVEEMADRCDGMVVMGRTVPDALLERLHKRGMPLVLLARPEVDGIDSVKADNSGPAEALTAHLADGGARSVSLVGDAALSPDVAERWTAVETAARRVEHLTVVPEPTILFDEASGAGVARRALEGALPDAFLCANDELALGVLTALADAGVEVPDRVQVTGWDDIMAARYAGLTTVRQPMRALGETAARLLDEVMTGSRADPRHVVLPTELVVRTTSGPSTLGHLGKVER